MRTDFPVFVFVLLEKSVFQPLHKRFYGAEKKDAQKKAWVQAFCSFYRVILKLALEVFHISMFYLSIICDEVNSSLEQMKTLSNL